MDCASAKGFSKGVDDGLGNASPPTPFQSYWMAAHKGVDPSLARYPAGLPPGVVVFHPSTRCLSHLHPTTLL